MSPVFHDMQFHTDIFYFFLLWRELKIKRVQNNISVCYETELSLIKAATPYAIPHLKSVKTWSFQKISRRKKKKQLKPILFLCNYITFYFKKVKFLHSAFLPSNYKMICGKKLIWVSVYFLISLVTKTV